MSVYRAQVLRYYSLKFNAEPIGFGKQRVVFILEPTNIFL